MLLLIVALEASPFCVAVFIAHQERRGRPQLRDCCNTRGRYLPAASHENARGNENGTKPEGGAVHEFPTDQITPILG